MKEQNALQTELEYFQKNKQEYLKLYKDQFVLIKGENFAGSFTTEAEAYKAGLEKFGNAPFLIRQVLDDDGTVSCPAFFIVNPMCKFLLTTFTCPSRIERGRVRTILCLVK